MLAFCYGKKKGGVVERRRRSISEGRPGVGWGGSVSYNLIKISESCFSFALGKERGKVIVVYIYPRLVHIYM